MRPQLSFATATKKEKAWIDESMFFSKVLKANSVSLSQHATPNISTLGFQVSEEVDQNWGKKRSWGSDKVMFMVAEKKVGTPTWRIISGELPPERVGLQIDQGGNEITTRSASSCGSSLGSHNLLMWLHNPSHIHFRGPTSFGTGRKRVRPRLCLVKFFWCYVCLRHLCTTYTMCTIRYEAFCRGLQIVA